ICKNGSTAGRIRADVVPFHHITRRRGTPGEMATPQNNLWPSPSRDDVARRGAVPANGGVVNVAKDRNAGEMIIPPRRQSGASRTDADVVSLNEIAGRRSASGIVIEKNSITAECNNVARPGRGPSHGVAGSIQDIDAKVVAEVVRTATSAGGSDD